MWFHVFVVAVFSVFMQADVPTPSLQERYEAQVAWLEARTQTGDQVAAANLRFSSRLTATEAAPGVAAGDGAPAIALLQAWTPDRPAGELHELVSRALSERQIASAILPGLSEFTAEASLATCEFQLLDDAYRIRRLPAFATYDNPADLPAVSTHLLDEFRGRLIERCSPPPSSYFPGF